MTRQTTQSCYKYGETYTSDNWIFNRKEFFNNNENISEWNKILQGSSIYNAAAGHYSQRRLHSWKIPEPPRYVSNMPFLVYKNSTWQRYFNFHFHFKIFEAIFLTKLISTFFYVVIKTPTFLRFQFTSNCLSIFVWLHLCSTSFIYDERGSDITLS